MRRAPVGYVQYKYNPSLLLLSLLLFGTEPERNQQLVIAGQRPARFPCFLPLFLIIVIIIVKEGSSTTALFHYHWKKKVKQKMKADSQVQRWFTRAQRLTPVYTNTALSPRRGRPSDTGIAATNRRKARTERKIKC